MYKVSKAYYRLIYKRHIKQKVMEQIKIIFFALASFFGIENGNIAAEKTTVTVHPKIKKIEIIQEKLFTIVQNENDSKLALNQWNEILSARVNNKNWSTELNNFPEKNLQINTSKNEIQPHIALNYKEENDLKVLGIWYNEKSNTFSINNIPHQHITTSDGKLEGNYWFFNDDTTFSFTIEPFMQMPEDYKILKKSLDHILQAK